MKQEETGFTYSCGALLMEAVRKLDYKQQYKVCEAFYKMLIKGFEWEGSEMCLRFHDDFEGINPKYLKDSLLRLHWCVNDMDNAISEIDDYDPMAFFEIEKRLAAVIKKSQR